MTQDHNQLFLDAAAAGDNAAILKALEEGIDLHVFENDALCRAASGGHTDTVALLLDHGANIHAYNDDALHRAARAGHKEMVALLLDRGADIHAGKDDALYWAAAGGHTDTVSLLLDRGADIDAKEGEVFRRAIFNNQEDTTLFLLRQGADTPITSLYDARLAQWLYGLKHAVSGHFQSTTPTYAECFNPEKQVLHERVLDACVTGQFSTLIGAPLLASANPADRQLFQHIWEALPAHWQSRNQNIYMQFMKENGIAPVIGQHTAAQSSGKAFGSGTIAR